MSRQIQIRRGTKNQHASFTGAIGEVTMDTTNKTLRVHDGVTVGGNEMLSRNGFFSYVTNCITEIPQDIKLELNGGVLILKAGSTVYVPKGAGVFNKKTTTTDVTTQNLSGYPNGKYLVFDNSDFSGTSIRCNLISACYSGATAPATGAVWYDTINNKIMVASGGTWTGNRTLPLGVITISNGTISSIDQVFNGFGYIGSTIFVLPGVKGLIPNGRNEDGTLKNKSMYNQIVRTVTRTSSGKRTMALASGGYFESFTSLNYDAETNFVYSTDGILRQYVSVLETESDASTKIISFNPKKVFSFIS